MARLVPIAIMAMILSAPAWSQSTQIVANSAPEAHARPQNYDIPDSAAYPSFGGMSGSRIVAGTELLPNTLVGIGMFGPKAEKSPHAAATARDLAVTRSRKAAVGLSLRF